MSERAAAPRVVEANPELDWFSIDDMIWLAWMDPPPDPLAARSDEAARLLQGNLLEAHHPVEPVTLKHGLGWIDITSGKRHKLVQLEPLTITASIACRGCAFHGFITNGHWVPA